MIVLTPGVSLGVCLRTMKKRLCCASEDKERRSVSVLEKNKFWTFFLIFAESLFAFDWVVGKVSSSVSTTVLYMFWA